MYYLIIGNYELIDFYHRSNIDYRFQTQSDIKSLKALT